MSLIKEVYDWNELVELVEKKSNKDIRNWNPNRIIGAEEWAQQQGFTNLECLDYKDKINRIDWDKRSQEMKNRVHIMSLYHVFYKEMEEKPEYQYQDFWHYVIAHNWCEVHNGSVEYFCPIEMIEDIKEEKDLWVKEILNYFIEVFKENNIPDEIQVHIWW